MTTLTIIMFTAFWLLGMAFTMGALGLRTRIFHASGQTFTGSTWMDVGLVIAWPIFWPCLAAHRLGSALVRRFG